MPRGPRETERAPRLAPLQEATAPPAFPSFREALRYWLALGWISFGGPTGQIAIMHRELVDRRRWISEGHFLHALNFCMLLPGPEAQQLATYLGWRLHGWRGGVAAGALFVLPSVFILYALSWIYMEWGDLPWLAAVFHGLLPAVIAVVAQAALRIGRRALGSPSLWALAAASFAAIYFFRVSFVLIVATAALLGWLGNRLAPAQFPAAGGHHADGAEEGASVALPSGPPASWTRAAGVAFVCLVLWWLPILALGAWQGWDGTPFQQGVFFSKAALVTFGGAYAVLPYVAQQAVERYGWLSHAQMMSGLALAETTPGPLIMVLQFVGFVGGWQHPGALAPGVAATLGALVTTWATFVPCFLFVLLGAPHVEKLREQPRLGAALTAVTAAVVGVILNLGVQFATHALWPEPSGRFDGFVAVVAAAAFVALQRFGAGLIPTIGACAALGLLWRAMA
jgi:chromate transporter